MCKGDFVYWKCFLDASSIYFFSNGAPEFTVSRIDKLRVLGPSFSPLILV